MSVQRFTERLKEYFTFTRKERNGIIFLVIIIVILQGIIIYTHYVKPVFGNPGRAAFEREIMAFENELNTHDTLEKSVGLHTDLSDPPKKIIADPGVFDPNSAGPEQWKEFGIKEKTIHAISNYLSKGGRFHNKEDLKKIYILKPEEYSRMEPFIVINNEQQEKKAIFGNDHKEDHKPVNIIELNKASVEDLMLLPLIGEKRAQQIVKYRNLLGGFVEKEQLKEIFSLPDSVYQLVLPRIKVDNSLISHININADSVSSLKHLYIRKPIANLIVNYRLQHGDYHEVEDLRKLPLMNDSLFRKISQYLIVE